MPDDRDGADANAPDTLVEPPRSDDAPTLVSPPATIIVPDDPAPRPAPPRTIVVPDDPAPRAAPPHTVVVPDDRRPPRDPKPPSWRSVVVVAAVATVVVACAVAALGIVLATKLVTGSPDPIAQPDPPSTPSCEGIPITAVLARFERGTPSPTREALRAHIGSLPPSAVSLVGHTEPRTVTLELARSSWPLWPRDTSPRDTCRTVTQQLANHGTHPLAFHDRPPPENLGTLATLDASHAALLDWLEPLQVTARCDHQERHDEPLLAITCEVHNPRNVPARARISPLLVRDGVRQPVHQDDQTLRPNQRYSRQYNVRGDVEDNRTHCGCEVTTLP